MSGAVNYFSTMNEGMDSRKHPRVSVNFVTVEVLTALGELQSSELCFVINVSQSGMLFRGQNEYTVSQPLVLTFTIPTKDMVIRTDAFVVHTQKLQTSCFYGVQFKNISLAEHAILKEYIEDLLEGH